MKSVTFKMLDDVNITIDRKDILMGNRHITMKELVKTFCMFYSACTYVTPLRFVIDGEEMTWDNNNGFSG
jgi:hypothetical protein